MNQWIVEPLERRVLLASILDPSFGQGGLFSLTGVGPGVYDPNDPYGITSSAYVSSFAPLTDGNFASVTELSSYDHASGESSQSYALIRSGPSPLAYPGYDTSNPALPSLSGSRVIAASNGKVILAGLKNNSIIVARFNATVPTDGYIPLDTTFGTTGISSISFPFDLEALNAPWAIDVDSGGRIVIAGMRFFSQDRSSGQLFVARFKGGGAVDLNFSGDGKSVSPTFAGEFQHLAIQPDDRIIAAGINAQSANNEFVARFDPAATLDTTFGVGGVVSYQRATEETVLSVAVQPDGKVLVGAVVSTPSDDPDGHVQNAIRRFTTSGVPDETFGLHGVVSSESVSPNDLLIAPTSGKITAVSNSFIRRFNSDGSLDLTFNQTGTATEPEVVPSGLATTSFQISDDVIILFAHADQIVRIKPRPALAIADNGTLIITAGSSNDSISLTRSGETTTTLVYNGQTTVYHNSFGTIDIDAGDGNNTISYSRDLVAVITTGSGADTIIVTPLVSTAENLHIPPDSISTGAGDDVVNLLSVGNFEDLPNTVDAGDGTDRLTFTGDDHAQSILGGAGNDTISAGDGQTKIYGGAGDDVITAGIGPGYTAASKRYVDAGEGSNAITLGDGFDEIFAGAGDDTIHTGPGDDTITSSGGTDSIVTSDGNDSITVSTPDIIAHPFIDSGAGDDYINGSHLAATVNAGDGADTIMLDAFGALATGVGQQINSGPGNDYIVTDARPDTINSAAGNDTVNSFAGPDIVRGGAGDDYLSANAGNQSLYGESGKDTLLGGAGSDLLSGGGGNDRIAGEGGADRIYGGAGDDQLSGGGGNDRLFGQAGADKLFGGVGNDLLDGGPSADIIAGGRNTDSTVTDALDSLFGVEAHLNV